MNASQLPGIAHRHAVSADDGAEGARGGGEAAASALVEMAAPAPAAHGGHVAPYKKYAQHPSIAPL